MKISKLQYPGAVTPSGRGIYAMLAPAGGLELRFHAAYIGMSLNLTERHTSKVGGHDLWNFARLFHDCTAIGFWPAPDNLTADDIRCCEDRLIRLSQPPMNMRGDLLPYSERLKMWHERLIVRRLPEFYVFDLPILPALLQARW